MRIKFLSVIVSLLFVSFAITSCLDDETSVEYSPDATIHAFAIDSTELGKDYKFTIDQLNGLIYNQDSLPLGSDTIIDKIQIATLTTVSGLVILQNKEGKDSLADGVLQGLGVVDSFDLRNPIKVKVMATEAVNLMYQGLPETQYQKYIRTYKIEVRVHQQDPDSLNWGQAKGQLPEPVKRGFSNGEITGRQKAVTLGEQILVYSKNRNNDFIAFSTNIADGRTWNKFSIGQLLPRTTDLSSMLEYHGMLYVVAEGKIYSSPNGSDWQLDKRLNRNDYTFKALLASYQPQSVGVDQPGVTVGISAIVMNDSKAYFALSDATASSWKIGVEVPGEFPKYDLSSTVYTTNIGVQSAMLMGSESAREEEEEEITPIVPWGSYDGMSWADLSTLPASACPLLKLPSIIHYGTNFYAFGNDFQKFYTSVTGIAWKETGPKFYFPEGLKKRTDSYYSMVVDKNNGIWIILSNSNGNDKTDDVWRCRLNKLAYD